MTTALDDDSLLVILAETLAPATAEPGADSMAALHQALAARFGGTEDDDAAPAAVVPFAVPKRRAGWAGIHRLRHPVAAAVAVGVLATSGVAAAGVATDHLPGPTRNVAYALGLPVTSPALEATEGMMAQLRSALVAHDVAQGTALAALLRTQLTALSTGDRAQVDAAATGLLQQADALAESGAPATAPGGTSTSGGTAGSSGTGVADGSGGSSRDGSSTPGGGTTSGDGSGSGSPGSTEGDPSSAVIGGGTSTGGGPSTTTEGPPETSPGTTPGTKPPTTTTTEPGDNSPDGGTDKGDSRVANPPTTTTTIAP